MSSQASKAAYQRCSETCQKVRAEISLAIERKLENLGIDLSSSTIATLTDAAFDAALKHGTEKVRAALIECEQELLEARDALDTAESDRESYRLDAVRLESVADDLRSEVSMLESKLDTALNS